MVWDRQPTVEEIVRWLWVESKPSVPGLVEMSLIEAHGFDRNRTVRL